MQWITSRDPSICCEDAFKMCNIRANMFDLDYDVPDCCPYILEQMLINEENKESGTQINENI